MVVGVLVNRDVHGANTGTLVTMSTQVRAPAQTQDADAVKKGEYRSQRTDHPAKRPFRKRGQNHNGDEQGDLYPEQFMDHEPDLGVDGHPWEAADKCTDRTELGKPWLERIERYDKNEACQNRVLDIGHPCRDIKLGRPQFIQDLLEVPEGADSTTGHPADGHAESYKESQKIHRDGSDDDKMLESSDGAGKDGTGTGIAVQSRNTYPPGLALPKGSRGDEPLQVTVGNTEPEGSLNYPSEQYPVQGLDGLLDLSFKFYVSGLKFQT